MNENTRLFLAIAAGLLVGVLLLVGVILIYWNFTFPQRHPLDFVRQMPIFRSFETNGEQIYFTGRSQTGSPISSTMPGMNRMRLRKMGCANCHGADGQGGRVTMMMTTLHAPDIRYSTLTEGEYDDEHGEGEHPPYSDEMIKEAITKGVDPSGTELSWVMPRWDMTEDQLDDLLNFLKTLR